VGAACLDRVPCGRGTGARIGAGRGIARVASV